ncbi:MAG: hypothetical protein EBY17_20240 [Acidobacteriia bacterium]|jgi:hypothetical protein|nr:hypothetical protein [Terriglobia bacterium]
MGTVDQVSDLEGEISMFRNYGAAGRGCFRRSIAKISPENHLFRRFWFFVRVADESGSIPPHPQVPDP